MRWGGRRAPVPHGWPSPGSCRVLAGLGPREARPEAALLGRTPQVKGRLCRARVLWENLERREQNRAVGIAHRGTTPSRSQGALGDKAQPPGGSRWSRGRGNRDAGEAGSALEMELKGPQAAFLLPETALLEPAFALTVRLWRTLTESGLLKSYKSLSGLLPPSPKSCVSWKIQACAYVCARRKKGRGRGGRAVSAVIP